MAQRSPAVKITLAILSRILLLVIAIAIGVFFFPLSMQNMVTEVLGYQMPSGFFGFTFADAEIAWFISSSLWVGILFGTLGKRIDYIFIAIFFLLASLDLVNVENMTVLIYSALIAATIIGNIIGFGLKLLKQKYLVR